MISLGYAKEDGTVISLHHLENGEVLKGDPPVNAILLSRVDFDVQIFDIPHLPAHEVEGLLRYRLRASYPGSPHETAFDYRIDSSKSRTRAIVFITRRATIQKLRAVAHRTPLLLPYLLIERTARALRDVRIVFCHHDWAEVTVFQGGVPASCTLVRRKTGTTYPVSRADKDLSEDMRAFPVLMIASKAEIDCVRAGEGAGLPANIRFLSIQELCARQRKLEGVFPEARRTHRFARPAVRIGGLSLLVAVLGTLVFFKHVRLVEDGVRKLKETSVVLEGQQREAGALQMEIKSLESELSQITAEEPPDAYLCLSELSRVLGSEVQIRSLQFRDNSFQLDALGSSALRLMEVFQASPSFSAVKLSQVVPDANTGTERFSFSGAFHVR